MNIGVLCQYTKNTAAAIHDHLEALTEGSRHNSFMLPLSGEKPLGAYELEFFDVLVIHYTLVMKDKVLLTPDQRVRIAQFPGVKAAFIQDEYRFVDETVAALAELNIDLLFTCVPEEEIEKVYPAAKLPRLRKINVLTGYVPAELLGRRTRPIAERPIDVGYRSRRVPDWLGELGWEKYYISERFAEDAPRYGLNVNISCREEDRIYGDAWIQFFSDCKAALGVESGASVFDFTGEIQKNVDEYKELHPEATFHELQRLFFADEEGRVRLNQISPRCFEAAALKTLMILYEGDYSGRLVPWRHYVPLKKDHSNMDEVVSVLRDPERAQAIVDATYTEVACNPINSYQALSDCFDDHVSQAAADNPWLKETNGPKVSVWRIKWHLVGMEVKRSLYSAMGWVYRTFIPKRGRKLAAFLVLHVLAAIIGPQRVPSYYWALRAGVQENIHRLPGYNLAVKFAARFRPYMQGRRRWLPFRKKQGNSIVFLNHAYYHFYLLAKELRRRGWDAWSISLHPQDSPQAPFFHGEDLNLWVDGWRRRWVYDRLVEEIKLKASALHFHGVGAMYIHPRYSESTAIDARLPEEFLELKRAGVKIGYSVVGCNDGVTQSAWRRWSGDMCRMCRFVDQEGVCSDIRNAAWGYKMMAVCDLVAAELMPRLDFLRSPKAITVPLTYCVDENAWRPDIEVPEHCRIERVPGEVLILHAVGNFQQRTEGGADPKGTRAILAAVDRLRAEGLPVRLHFVEGVASRDMKYLQVQADIIVDQLLFGRYGAQARECLMLGKPVVGNLTWDPATEDEETAQCLSECPIVHATVDTIYEVLKDLVTAPEKLAEIGRRSREYALHWHSIAKVADRFEREYAHLGVKGDSRK